MTSAPTPHRLADDPSMPRPGTVLNGRYEVKGVLGEGGFAAVFRAHDRSTNAEVAVKVLDPVMSRRPELAARFLREVETISRLKHHNTIKVYDKGTHGDCLFLVMEMLDGIPLDTCIEKHGPIAPERVRRIAIQVLKSLSEAHGLGIIHRDIKPANVFLVNLPGEEDYIKVLDFGIAKSLDSEDNTALTSTGQVMCSPHYVAPERVVDHVTIPASDIYSLGVMMIEMLEGHSPYNADTSLQLVMMHARVDQPVPMRAETLQSPLGPILQRATAKRYAERYQNAGDMLRDLQAIGAIAAFPGPHDLRPPGTADYPNTGPTGNLHQNYQPQGPPPGYAPQPGYGTPPAGAPPGYGAPPQGPPGPWTPASAQAPHAASGPVEPARKRSMLIPMILLLIVVLGGLVAFLVIQLTGETSDGPVATASQQQAGGAAVPQTPGALDPNADPLAPTDADPTVVPGTPASFAVSSTPPNAAVRINDTFMGLTPVVIPGERVTTFPANVELQMPDGQTRQLTLRSAAELVDLSFTFDDNVAAAEPGEDPVEEPVAGYTTCSTTGRLLNPEGDVVRDADGNEVVADRRIHRTWVAAEQAAAREAAEAEAAAAASATGSSSGSSSRRTGSSSSGSSSGSSDTSSSGSSSSGSSSSGSSSGSSSTGSSSTGSSSSDTGSTRRPPADTGTSTGTNTGTDSGGRRPGTGYTAPGTSTGTGTYFGGGGRR